MGKFPYRRKPTEGDVLQYIIDNPDFSDELARRLEIEADGGDTPGGFIRGCAQQWMADRMEAAGHRMIERARRFSQRHPSDSEGGA